VRVAMQLNSSVITTLRKNNRVVVNSQQGQRCHVSWIDGMGLTKHGWCNSIDHNGQLILQKECVSGQPSPNRSPNMTSMQASTNPTPMSLNSSQPCKSYLVTAPQGFSGVSYRSGPNMQARFNPDVSCPTKSVVKGRIYPNNPNWLNLENGKWLPVRAPDGVVFLREHNEAKSDLPDPVELERSRKSSEWYDADEIKKNIPKEFECLKDLDEPRLKQLDKDLNNDLNDLADSLEVVKTYKEMVTPIRENVESLTRTNLKLEQDLSEKEVIVKSLREAVKQSDGKYKDLVKRQNAVTSRFTPKNIGEKLQESINEVDDKGLALYKKYLGRAGLCAKEMSNAFKDGDMQVNEFVKACPVIGGGVI